MGNVARGRLVLTMTTAIVVSSVSMMLLAGCGGESGIGGVAETGIVRGSVVEAGSVIGLGGVVVEIGTVSEGEFKSAGSATSVTPDGEYVIDDLPPGTYDTLHVVPNEVIGVEGYVSKKITIVVGETKVLPPIHIVRDEPPSFS